MRVSAGYRYRTGIGEVSFLRCNSDRGSTFLNTGDFTGCRVYSGNGWIAGCKRNCFIRGVGGGNGVRGSFSFTGNNRKRFVDGDARNRYVGFYSNIFIIHKGSTRGRDDPRRVAFAGAGIDTVACGKGGIDGAGCVAAAFENHFAARDTIGAGTTCFRPARCFPCESRVGSGEFDQAAVFCQNTDQRTAGVQRASGQVQRPVCIDAVLGVADSQFASTEIQRSMHIHAVAPAVECHISGSADV